MSQASREFLPLSNHESRETLFRFSYSHYPLHSSYSLSPFFSFSPSRLLYRNYHHYINQDLSHLFLSSSFSVESSPALPPVAHPPYTTVLKKPASNLSRQNPREVSSPSKRVTRLSQSDPYRHDKEFLPCKPLRCQHAFPQYFFVDIQHIHNSYLIALGDNLPDSGILPRLVVSLWNNTSLTIKFLLFLPFTTLRVSPSTR